MFLPVVYRWLQVAVLLCFLSALLLSFVLLDELKIIFTEEHILEGDYSWQIALSLCRNHVSGITVIIKDRRKSLETQSNVLVCIISIMCNINTDIGKEQMNAATGVMCEE